MVQIYRVGWGACLLAALLVAAPASVAAAPATSDDQTAAGLSANARAAYERGEFADAIVLYKKAYDKKADPTLLFNLGRCFEALATPNDLREAVSYYERYLAARHEATDRAAVERRADVLRQQIRAIEDADRAKAMARPPPLPPIVVQAPPPRGRVSPAPWIVAGVGGAGLIAGGVLGLLSNADHASAVTATHGADATRLESDAKTFATAANVAFVAGGVIALVGVTWGLVGAATNRPRAGAIQLHVGAGGLAGSVAF
jgi:tetratricopeptide (TPR) repeat protein